MSYNTHINSNFFILNDQLSTSESWQKVPIESIATKIAMGPFGSNIKTENFIPIGVPVIRGANLMNNTFSFKDFVFLSDKKADELSNSNAFEDDIIFTHRGTLGQVAIIPSSNYRRFVISQSQMKLTCDKEIAWPKFIYYFFTSPRGQYELLKNVSQTGVPAISRPTTSLKSIILPLPPLHEQRAIAHVLGSLDDKIELNREMNRTLEELARTVFKAWFVDFEGQTQFEEVEGRRVPVGWKVCPFEDIFNIVGGGTPSRKKEEYWGGTIPWFSIKDLPSFSDVFIMDTDEKITELGLRESSTKLLRAGTIIVTARGTVGEIAIAAKDMCMNQSCYGLVEKNVGVGFAYFSMRQKVAELLQKAHGGVFDTITTNTLKGLSFVCPPEFFLKKYDKFVGPLLAKIHANNEQSRTLRELRDTLLPKLISGELRVRDAERFL